MLEFFHPPSLNQQSELMQGHPDNLSTTMPCHERTGKFDQFFNHRLIKLQSHGQA